ncbi:MAG: hypothetical protein JO039_03705 [Solirubrobacterales bacterium]|nr:hypothetical protein [Solirubrobacterales bacterium]
MDDVEVDDLYGLPLEQFVSERTTLSRELRAQGRREEAGEVARLRKPSVAAWAVNQLVRTQGNAVRELFGAGDALRDAHEQAVSGRGDGAALRTAAERERAAVDALVVAARGLLSADGHELSTAIIDRVAETLHAAALEDQAREQVRDARLEHELRHVGLGDLAVSAVTSPAPARKPAPARPAAPRASQPAEAKAAARERLKAREAARTAEAAAKRRAARAARAVQAAEERRERAAQVLRDADEALAAAQAEADEAEDEHREAQERLENL